MKPFFNILFIAIFVNVKAQTSIDARIAAFDKVEYFPDSSIKCVYKVKNGVYNGYAIEFNESGQAIYIGKYFKGKKDGPWFNKDGTSLFYKKGEWEDGIVPGCGTGVAIAKKKFEELYYDLIHSKKK